MRRPWAGSLALWLTLTGVVLATENSPPPPPPPLPGVNPEAAYPFDRTQTQPTTPVPVPAPEPPIQVIEKPAKDQVKEEECGPWLPIIPELLGDQAPITILLPLRPGLAPNPGQTHILVPSPRYFKVGDNNSPEPRSRSYYTFNYFYDWGDAVNTRLGGGIKHTRIHRGIFGWEFADKAQTSSFAIQFPLATYNAANDILGLNGTHTTFGDLALVFKEVVWRDEEAGNLISGGLAIVTPTGPRSFAGVENIGAFHDVVLQPFIGWIFRHGSVYVQGFSAVDAPCNLNDVVVLNNDIAAGWFLYQTHRKDSLTAVVPTVEVHINTPLNHRGILNSTDKAATPDMIHLTSGVQFEYRDHSSLGIGFSVPLTGPRMYDFEILAQLRWRY